MRHNWGANFSFHTAFAIRPHDLGLICAPGAVRGISQVNPSLLVSPTIMAVARSTRFDDTGHPYPNHPATLTPSQQHPPLGRSRSSSMPAHMYHSKAGLDYNGAYHYSDQFTSTLSSQPRGIMAPPHLPLNASLDSVLLAPPSAPTVSPSSLSRTFVRSKSGMLVVTDFAPTEGEENVPITVGVLLDANSLPDGMTLVRGSSEVKLRLVFGRTAVKTDVKRMLPGAEADAMSGNEGRHSLHLKLNAFIPPYADSRFPEQRGVPMSVQMMGGQDNIIESFTFGMFTYWGPGSFHFCMAFSRTEFCFSNHGSFWHS